MAENKIPLKGGDYTIKEGQTIWIEPPDSKIVLDVFVASDGMLNLAVYPNGDEMSNPIWSGSFNTKEEVCTCDGPTTDMDGKCVHCLR